MHLTQVQERVTYSYYLFIIGHKKFFGWLAKFQKGGLNFLLSHLQGLAELCEEPRRKKRYFDFCTLTFSFFTT